MPLPFPELFEGIVGMQIETEDEVIVFYAQALEPGKGNFSRYVDDRLATYPKSKTLRAIGITNPIVKEMLLRRGFVERGLLEVVRYGVPD